MRIRTKKPNCIHSDWLTHQHRDTLASIVGHPTLASYLAIADGESIGRIRFEMTEVRGLVPDPAARLYPVCSACCSLADLLLEKMRIEEDILATICEAWQCDVT